MESGRHASKSLVNVDSIVGSEISFSLPRER